MLTAIAGLNPWLWERTRVLRPLWTELPAQTVRVHSMQKSADAVLVPIHEFDDHFCGRALQHGSGLVLVAAADDVEPRARFVAGMVLVQSGCGHVRLGAPGHRVAGLGLFRVERSPAEGQGLVHAQAADVLAGGGRSAAAALVDSGGPASVAILRYDRPAPWSSRHAGMERRAVCYRSSLHRSRIARPSAGPRENVEPCQHGDAVAGADDDGGRLVADVLKSGCRREPPPIIHGSYLRSLLASRPDPVAVTVNRIGAFREGQRPH